jgi:glycine reductase
VVHYLNQFFAGIGAEEAAAHGPVWLEGAKGPGQLIASLAPGWEVVGTLAAGDDHVAGDLEHAVPDLLRVLRKGLAGRHVDVVVAGPAFNAGRYGMACAALCQRVQEDLGIPAVTALYPENPAVDSYRRHVTIVRSGADVMDMREAMARLLRVAAKRVRGEVVEAAADDTITAGLRQNYFAGDSGARRAIRMLMRRLEGGEVITEYPMPVFDRVAPAPGIGDARRCTIALVTSGGIVPRGNPDHIEAANASRFGEYSLEGLDALSSRTHQSVHGGYDPTYANEDPNRVLPLDAARAFERSGRIGRLHPVYFATVGNATSVERAKRYGADIAVRLVNEGVQAVVFTST